MNERPAYDAVSADFLVLIGQIVIGWSRIERAMDIALATVHGRAPWPLAQKIKWMKTLCVTLPELIPHERRIVATLEEVDQLSKYRNTIVHGYFHGVSHEDEPQIYFRRAAPLTGEAGHRVLATRTELETFIQRVRKADEDLMAVMLIVVGALRKRPPPRGPRLP